MNTNELSEEQFIKKLKSLPKAISVQDKVLYDEFHFDEQYLYGIRHKTNGELSPFKISLVQLHKAYLADNKHNTKSLKPFVNGVQSPALAILLETDLTKHKNKKRQNHE